MSGLTASAENAIHNVTTSVGNLPTTITTTGSAVISSITSVEFMKKVQFGMAIYLLVCLIYLYVFNLILEKFINDRFKIRRMGYDELVTKTIIFAVGIAIVLYLFGISDHYSSIPVASVCAVLYVKFHH